MANRMCWHWDPVRHAYFLNGEKEMVLALIFKSACTDDINRKLSDFADVWVWRQSRNDPAKFADDMSSNKKLPFTLCSLKMDNGTSSWFSRYFSEFAGAELPRFYSRIPTGSAGDVKGRCLINNGIVVHEFARKLKTGNSDDLDLDSPFTLRIIIK
jgi:hypothetical protein